jgi:hypothetical protein
MKLWFAFGSEHSSNLVMIGRFKSAGDATKAQQVIERLIARVNADVDAKQMNIGGSTERFGDEMQELLREVAIYTLAPAELEQFAFEAEIEVDNDLLVVTTEEIDVSAFLKVLLGMGARVEVYSAHDYPGTGHGRGG